MESRLVKNNLLLSILKRGKTSLYRGVSRLRGFLLLIISVHHKTLGGKAVRVS